MFGKNLFEEVTSKLSETIANSPAKDVEKNVKAMLGSAFNRMDLVTREEFDIQQQVLIKTRTKLVELEARLAKLEAAQNPAAAEEAVVEASAAKVEAAVESVTKADTAE
ncbi:accessory factor UbiK family protein [Neisseria sp. CCUG12390]|uniref:accessory factor UbiK family protein n=1 Tax=Neisseria sp. CCUG12390 TaxID=3392035 RepID=UPI003A0FBBEA